MCRGLTPCILRCRHRRVLRYTVAIFFDLFYVSALDVFLMAISCNVRKPLKRSILIPLSPTMSY